MGWQTWCSVGPCGEDHCHDAQIREMADTLKSNGMYDLGYKWIVLDDCWHPHRAANGSLVPFERFFPSGMKPVIDYVHSLGIQVRGYFLVFVQLLEKYGTLIERYTPLIENVSALIGIGIKITVGSSTMSIAAVSYTHLTLPTIYSV